VYVKLGRQKNKGIRRRLLNYSKTYIEYDYRKVGYKNYEGTI